MYYIFETHQYKKGELFFRNLEKQEIATKISREYLGFILIYTPPRDRKDISKDLLVLKQLRLVKYFKKELGRTSFVGINYFYYRKVHSYWLPG